MTLSFLKQYYKSIIIGAIILWLSLSENESINPGRIFNIPYSDKLGHLLAYMFFSGVLMLDSAKWRRTGNFRFLLIIIPVLFGALMELLQRLLTQGRQADILDMLANLTGIFLGLSAALVFRRLLKSDA